MLRGRVAIRYSRNVIGDAARTASLVGAVEPLTPFVRHEVRRGEKMREKIAQNTVGFGPHAHHFFVAINTPEQEALDVAIGRLEWRREAGNGRSAGANVGGRARRQSGKTRAALHDHILDETRDHPSHEFVDEAGRSELRRLGLDLVEEPCEKSNFAEVSRIEKPRPRAVVDVVCIVSDIIGNGRDLGLTAREPHELERMARVIFEDGERHASLAIAPGRSSLPVKHRAIVLDEAFERLPSEVEAVEMRVAALQPGHEAQGLRIMVETSVISHAIVERILPRMAEGRMAEVMRQCEGFGEVLIEPQGSCERTGDLRDLDRMGEARAKMVPFMVKKDLRLVRQAPKCRGMDDPVAIALEFGACRGGRLGYQAAARARGIDGIIPAPAL